MSRFYLGQPTLLCFGVAWLAACHGNSGIPAASPDAGGQGGVVDAASPPVNSGVGGATSGEVGGAANGGADGAGAANGGAGGAANGEADGAASGGAGGGTSLSSQDGAATKDGYSYAVCDVDADNKPCELGAFCVFPTGGGCTCYSGTWSCRRGPTSTEAALTGIYRGQDNQACWACAKEKCLDPHLAEPCESVLAGGCLSVLKCEMESGCAFGARGVLGCYCGSTAPFGECLYTDRRDGICRQEIQDTTAKTTSLGVLPIYSDAQYGLGTANRLADCLAKNGCTSCLPHHGDNVCPIATAFEVPKEVLVGQSGTLSGQGSDPDNGPSPTTITWSTPLRPGGGSPIADRSAGQTSYRCASEGTDTITLAISDGDGACTWTKSQSLKCLAYSCSRPNLEASARAAFTGGTVVFVLTPGSGPPASGYAWSTSNDVGELDASNPERAVLTCKKQGVLTVTMAAHGPDGGCGTTQIAAITCLEPPNGVAVAPQDTRSALLGDYRGLDREGCWACASAYCIDAGGTLPCELWKDPVERQLCLGLLQCELESGCGPSYPSPGLGPCYRAADGKDGPCARQIENALLSTDESFISRQLWSDGSLPGDPADILTNCLALNRCTGCFVN